MDIHDLHTLVESRRSIRGYDESREVSADMIQSILDCAARWAPSGGNEQPWSLSSSVTRIRVIRSPIFI